MKTGAIQVRRVGSRGRMDVKVTLLRTATAQEHHWILGLCPKL